MPTRSSRRVGRRSSPICGRRPNRTSNREPLRTARRPAPGPATATSNHVGEETMRPPSGAAFFFREEREPVGRSGAYRLVKGDEPTTTHREAPTMKRLIATLILAAVPVVGVAGVATGA